MWCHDISDIFLEFAKLCKYSKYEKTADVAFAIFMIVFFVRLVNSPFFHDYDNPSAVPGRPFSSGEPCKTHVKPIFSRLVYFPNLIWLTCIKSVPFNPFPAYNIIIGFLLTLQVLHCIWFYMILRIAASVLQGKPVQDDRSDQEDFEESSEDENQKTK